MRIHTVVGLSLIGALGCTDGAPREGSSTSLAVVNNKLSANKLSANKLSANKLSANKLSANKLSANKLQLTDNGGDLIKTPEGREVLEFIVSCAVPEGKELDASFEGTDYQFFGELGLAPQWLTHPLDDDGAGWVSACLFARVNALDVPIPISLRGSTNKLVVSDDEFAGWTLQEGAFYGNFFTPDDQPIDWNACRGADQAAGETGGLVDRDCAEPDPANPGFTLCGFNYAGDCGDFAETFACERFVDHEHHNATYYEDCARTSAFSEDRHGQVHEAPHTHEYKQVITTYVVSE